MSDTIKDIVGRIPDHKPPQDFFGTTTLDIDDELGRRYIYDPYGMPGGMATVYKGWDHRLGIPVAIKIGAPTIDPKTIDQEAHRLASLDHPNVIKILDLVSINDNQLAIIMKYFDPEYYPSLEMQLRQHSLELSELPNYARGLAGALDYLHANGQLHNDVKPKNILIDSKLKRAVLIDLGIATPPDITRSEGAGSYLFVSPERLMLGEYVDPRSDFYSLAVTLFYAVANKMPYGTDLSEDTILDYIVNKKPDLTPLDSRFGGSSEKLKEFFTKALSKNKAARFQNGEEFANAFSQATRSLSAL